MTLESLWRRIRQNHALEHATMHLLSRRVPGVPLMGRSHWNGFVLYGDVEARQVLETVYEALSRLRRGEHWLAVHPRCGTSLAVAALLVAGLGFAGSWLGRRSLPGRAAGVLLGCLVAAALADPVGLAVQRHLTTDLALDDVHVQEVSRELVGSVVVHRVTIGSAR